MGSREDRAPNHSEKETWEFIGWTLCSDVGYEF